MFPSVLCLLPLFAAALHPRPEYSQTASYARWLVHESDYAVVATHHGDGGVFSNIISIADGEGPEHSTGVIYTYIPSLDATYEDLKKNSSVSVTWSEMALANGTSGGCLGTTAEDPPCGRVTITGKLTKVPEANKSTAMKYLFASHPVMKEWSAAHIFEPFWVEPSSITELFVINMFGGAHPITKEEYLAADWYRKDMPKGDFVCHTCGHTYDPNADGKGVPFENLPDTWTCPVCGAPKSAYRKTTRGGRDVWVHAGEDTLDGGFKCSVCQHVYDPQADGKGVAFEKLPDTWKCPVCGAPKSAFKKTTNGAHDVWVHADEDTLDGGFVCSVCNHVYDPQADGKGVPFEKLPDTWKCPVCGAPKSAYKKTTRGGRDVWVHDDHAQTTVVV